MSFCRVLTRVSTLEHSLSSRLDLTPLLARALVYLLEAKPCCVRKLTELLEVHPTSTSKVVARLESMGLVDRSLNAHDRRMERLELTEAGREKALSVCAYVDFMISHSIPVQLRAQSGSIDVAGDLRYFASVLSSFHQTLSEIRENVF